MNATHNSQLEILKDASVTPRSFFICIQTKPFSCPNRSLTDTSKYVELTFSLMKMLEHPWSKARVLGGTTKGHDSTTTPVTLWPLYRTTLCIRKINFPASASQI